MFLATIGLRGLGHDGGRGVAVLHIARSRADHPRRRATLQAQACTQRRQRRNQYRDDEFDDLLLAHHSPPFPLIKSPFSS